MEWEFEQPDKPEARWWAQPITPEEFAACMPDRIELIDGHILGDAEDDAARLKLLALLLKNCGLEAAVALNRSQDDWREALEHNFIDFF